MTEIERFSPQAARRWVSSGCCYRPTGRLVRAERLSTGGEWESSSGARMRSQSGDWLITDGQQRWSVDSTIFAATYELVEDGWFRKVAPVRARRLDHSVRIETPEGEDTLQPGDWLVTGSTGECWGMSEADFRERYRPV